MSLYWMRCATLSQWRDCSPGVVLKTRAGSDATSQGALDSLESLELWLWKVVVERVAVVKFRMNQRCDSVEVQGCAYASEVTDMIVASLWEIRYVLVEGKVWVKDDTQVSCWFHECDWLVVRKCKSCKSCLFVSCLDSWVGRPMMRNSVFDWLRVRKLEAIHWDIAANVAWWLSRAAWAARGEKEMNN